jgi:hypothetical protein
LGQGHKRSYGARGPKRFTEGEKRKEREEVVEEAEKMCKMMWDIASGNEKFFLYTESYPRRL